MIIIIDCTCKLPNLQVAIQLENAIRLLDCIHFCLCIRIHFILLYHSNNLCGYRVNLVGSGVYQRFSQWCEQYEWVGQNGKRKTQWNDKTVSLNCTGFFRCKTVESKNQFKLILFEKKRKTDYASIFWLLSANQVWYCQQI